MTKITSITKTYTPLDGDMVHTGFFIATDNYRLKYVTKWSSSHIIRSPRFELDLDTYISHLEDAQ